MDKAKEGKDWGWEVGVGGVGESGSGKIDTTELEQQYKNKNIYFCKDLWY